MITDVFVENGKLRNEESERILKEIEIRLRVGKLDSTLLFLCSSLSFLFGLLQTLLGGIQTMTYFLPFLILGWVLPFYYGYIKGAILDNSVVERSIGWAYLLLGSLAYVSTLLSNLVPRIVPQWPIVKPVILFLPFIMGVLLGPLVFRISKKIFEICGKKRSYIEMRILRFITHSVGLFAAAGYFYAVLYQDMISGDPLSIFLISFVTAIGLLEHINGISTLKHITRPYHIEKREGRPRIALFGLFLIAGGTISTILTIHSFSINTTIPGLFLIGVGSLLFFESSDKEEIVFETAGVKKAVKERKYRLSLTRRNMGLLIISCLLVPTSVLYYWFIWEPQQNQASFENYYLEIMNNLNDTDTRTTLRSKFDRDYNFTDLYEWVNTQIRFVPLDETIDKRYTDPFSILGYGKGRCGEFSILYVATCLAHGYQSRLAVSVYVGNWTGLHVWTEVYFSDQWVHVDPSERIWNSSKMYEEWEWGKEIGNQVRIYVFEDGRSTNVTSTYKSKD